MTKPMFPLDKFGKLRTPFYYYDLRLLDATLQAIGKAIADRPQFQIHYAVKANANPAVLERVRLHGLGADCVSMGEIKASINMGIPAEKIVFAGVGKTDEEIIHALDQGIGCFNVESLEELQIIDSIASSKKLKAPVAIRFNPDINASTIAQITTGTKENKFGIASTRAEEVIGALKHLTSVRFCGLHMHIGSQLLVMDDFEKECHALNTLATRFSAAGLHPTHINVGGGLGVDYTAPDAHPIPDFEKYFEVFKSKLKTNASQTVHFELGRSVVAQCGTLIARAVYVKQGVDKRFVILDAGMNDLVRPAMYAAQHRIENLSSVLPEMAYDVVGPVCESTDIFAKDIRLPQTHRGDLLAIRSAGAYGESMASTYNMRPLPLSYTTEQLTCD